MGRFARERSDEVPGEHLEEDSSIDELRGSSSYMQIPRFSGTKVTVGALVVLVIILAAVAGFQIFG